MNHYLINKNADEKGRNEIHKTNICGHLPDPKNRENLGWFSSDEDALKHAKDNGYPKADGCYYCCEKIHRG